MEYRQCDLSDLSVLLLISLSFVLYLTVGCIHDKHIPYLGSSCYKKNNKTLYENARHFYRNQKIIFLLKNWLSNQRWIGVPSGLLMSRCKIRRFLLVSENQMHDMIRILSSYSSIFKSCIASIL